MDVCHLLVSFCNVVHTTPMWSIPYNTIVVALFTQGGVGVVSQELTLDPGLLIFLQSHMLCLSHIPSTCTAFDLDQQEYMDVLQSKGQVLVLDEPVSALCAAVCI